MASPACRVARLSSLFVLLCGCTDSERASGPGNTDASGATGGVGLGGTGGAAAGSGASAGADASTPEGCRLKETFESFTPGSWGDGTFGEWTPVYIDTVGIETDGSKVHFQRPIASTSSDETHANLVVTSQSFPGDLDFNLRIKTVEQLRTGTEPNNWEVAWVFWNYLRPEQSYYFAPKPVGWELGKSDDTKADPNGPECDFPSYTNCLYPGAQSYLATGSSPSFAVGEWHTVRITQSGGAISVWVNGSPIVSVTDSVNVLQDGQIGLYNEDAHVRFDDVCVK